MDSTVKATRVLRATDRETARVVAIHRNDGAIVGAGCLVDASHILTCKHVIEAAIGKKAKPGCRVYTTLAGVSGQPTIVAQLAKAGGSSLTEDLALLLIWDEDASTLSIAPVEFASPLQHGRKPYSVLGFPGGDAQGRNATGILNAADAKGLVQMDRGGALSVLGGFSGAPVWCSEIGAFVGLVVTELFDSQVAWCIPSRLLSRFHNDLIVRFRVPESDRPVIHDYVNDDPNIQLFGQVSDNGERRLTASVARIAEGRRDGGSFQASIMYECLDGSAMPRGQFVTFITFPDFTGQQEDRYEIFARIQNGVAQTTIYPDEPFTLAAIGDGGDTILTFNLNDAAKRPKDFVHRER